MASPASRRRKVVLFGVGCARRGAGCGSVGHGFLCGGLRGGIRVLMDHFAAEYRRGRTPNPCVLCNQQLKFGHLFRLADDVGAEAVATGHYARVVDGQLRSARDVQKDQTYYLFGIERAALRRTLFPLGDLTKPEVRAIAAEAGLSTAEKPESMEICFVTSGDYRDVVRARRTGGPAASSTAPAANSAATTASMASRSASARACRRSARRTTSRRSCSTAATSCWCRATGSTGGRRSCARCTGSSMRRRPVRRCARR